MTTRRRRTPLRGRPWLVAAVLVVALAALAGCGGGDSSTESEATTAAPPAETSAPAETGSPSAGGETGAASGDIDSLVAAAQEEGTVVVYALSEESANALTTGFKEAYPWADVQAVVGSPGDNASRLVTETQSGAPTADVVILPPPQRPTLIQSDAVVPIDVPAQADYPAELLDPTGYAHPVYIIPIVTVYNTNLLDESEVPTDMADFADPKWKGKIAFDRPQNRALSATWLASKKDIWGDDQWQAWLKGLSDNDIFITSDATAAYEAALRGEVEIAITTLNDINTQPAGTPMAAAFYQDVVPFLQYSWATKAGAHPNMAKLFIDWMMSPAGQTNFSEEQGQSPALPTLEVPNALSNLIPPEYTLMDVSKLQPWFDDPDSYMSVFDQYWPG